MSVQFLEGYFTKGNPVFKSRLNADNRWSGSFECTGFTCKTRYQSMKCDEPTTQSTLKIRSRPKKKKITLVKASFSQC